MCRSVLLQIQGGNLGKQIGYFPPHQGQELKKKISLFYWLPLKDLETFTSKCNYFAF